MDNKARALEIFARLDGIFPLKRSLLDWKTPWELLVATVLAAQCTDARVNLVTPDLFKRWPDAAGLAKASQPELEQAIRSTGFFRQKAKNLLATAKILVERYDGQPPASMALLTQLPGVARKTANIILSGAYGINEGIAVDTHVRRLAYRLGLTRSSDPKVIERDLMPLFPQTHWGDLNHLLVQHGRAVCRARKPDCRACALNELCPKLFG